jgi:hypothetical protein
VRGSQIKAQEKEIVFFWRVMFFNNRATGLKDFGKIKNTVKEFEIDTLRIDADAQFEAVLFNKEMDKLRPRLENLLGSAVFPSQNDLSAQISQHIDAYGGIASGQTLFYTNIKNDVIFAMLWPWQDGLHTTIKIIQESSIQG